MMRGDWLIERMCVASRSPHMRAMLGSYVQTAVHSLVLVATFGKDNLLMACAGSFLPDVKKGG